MSWWNDPSKFGSIEQLIVEAFERGDWLSAIKGAAYALSNPTIASPLSSDAVAVRPAEEVEPKKDPLRNIVGRY